MPRNRVRVAGDTTIIELAVPINLSGEGGSSLGFHSCHICAHTFCADDDCCRHPTHLTCCTQVICTKCVSKLAKRCRCSDTCAAIIALCPYCREISPLTPLDLYKGYLPDCVACAPDPLPAPSSGGPPEPSSSSSDNAVTSPTLLDYLFT